MDQSMTNTIIKWAEKNVVGKVNAEPGWTFIMAAIGLLSRHYRFVISHLE